MPQFQHQEKNRYKKETFFRHDLVVIALPSCYNMMFTTLNNALDLFSVAHDQEREEQKITFVLILG